VTRAEAVRLLTELETQAPPVSAVQVATRVSVLARVLREHLDGQITSDLAEKIATEPIPVVEETP
jgi:hypothetical protein